MQRTIKSLIGYSMEATDGDIGKVEEFYFEDTTWMIRYLVLKTGNWFLYRKVLIAPQAIINKNAPYGVLPVNLSKNQIRTSPDVDTNKPVSRQQDMQLYGHYAWQRYGGSGFYAGGSAAAMDNVPIIDEKVKKEAGATDKQSDDDLHLRSTKTIMGYHIHAADGDFGHVSDFIFDDANWQIVYIVVDTHGWFGGKKILIETGRVKEIQWENSKVILDISINSLKDHRTFDESQFNQPEISSTPLVTG
ncbi:MAG: PRC-barrel domain-containing protein [Bacteroidota bacterium]|nr:PRC-barrel domain-containing protein [Bacteroidota bacterium]